MELRVDAITVGVLVYEPIEEGVDGLVQVACMRDCLRNRRPQRVNELLPQCLLPGGCVIDHQRGVLDPQRLKDRDVVPRRDVDASDACDVGNRGVAQQDEALLDTLRLVYVDTHAATAHVSRRHACAALDVEDVGETLSLNHRHQMMV
jgi:hypothetical protein